MGTPDGLKEIEVVILAGGRGTRLRSLPGDIPKPLRPVGGRPFLAYLLEQVRGAGARRAVLALGYKAEAFGDFLRTGTPRGLEVQVSVEESPMGTGGALRAALPLLHGETILAMNGDSYAGADLGRLVEVHRSRGARVTILLARVEDAARFGRVDVGPEGAVLGFAEKGAGGPGLINAGIYVMQRAAVADIPSGRPVSLERDVLPGLVGKSFFAERGDGPFGDIGTPESYRSLDDRFRKMRGPR